MRTSERAIGPQVVRVVAPVAAAHAVWSCIVSGAFGLACSSEGQRTVELQTHTAQVTVVRTSTPRPRLVIGRVLRAVAHPRGPDGHAGIHTELVIAVDVADSTPSVRTARLWIPGGRLGRHARVISHQPHMAVNQRGVFLTVGSSAMAAPLAHVVKLGTSDADVIVALANGEELQLSALRERLRIHQVSR